MKTILAALAVVALASTADAQGIYMANGRATPSVIVGADGKVWPVIPTPCQGEPCPVVLAPPRARGNNGYLTCSIARYCLRQDGGGWVPPSECANGRADAAIAAPRASSGVASGTTC